MEEEEIQPPEFPFNIEEDVFQNFGNTSMYPREKGPPVPKETITPPDKASLQEEVKGVTAIMNSEWVHEGEMSLEAIRIQTPLYTLPYFIQGTAVFVLYSPTIGANIMSASFALSHLSDNPLLPTSRSLWIGPCSTIEGIEILHDVLVWYDKTEIALDFHIFKVQHLDVLIGHPVEKLFQNISPLGALDITLGGRAFSSPILRSKDSLAEPMPQEEQDDKVQAFFPAKTPESSLEKDSRLFIQEENDQE